MSEDPLQGLSEIDAAAREAVDAMDGGDVSRLKDLLAQHPHLVRARMPCGAGYFANPYLLWFVAGNPVRKERLPRDAPLVARTILEAAAALEVETLREQASYALALVSSGRVPRESGVQLGLIDMLVEAGADPTGALNPALAHHEEAAVHHLLERGARMTLVAAAGVGRVDSLTRLAERATPEERQAAFATAAAWGRADSLRALATLGARVNDYNPAGFHAHGTALHNAVAANSLSAVEALLEIGADPTVRDKIWNGTALDWATHLGAEEIASVLRHAAEP